MPVKEMATLVPCWGEGEKEEAGTLGLPTLQGNGCLSAALAVSSKQTDQVGWKQGSDSRVDRFCCEGRETTEGR